MYSITKPFKTISLFGTILFAAASARAVSPPPDGGYANGNTAEGQDSLFSLTSGINNTAIGFQALFANTIGNANTATGFLALRSNTTGVANTANGLNALSSNTTGIGNTATGASALDSNTIGFGNTADGSGALSSNTSGGSNTAVGEGALGSNTTANNNTAVGASALSGNDTGEANTAVGGSALGGGGRVGIENTAVGFGALYYASGSNNTGVGGGALFGVFDMSSGSNNTATGAIALGANAAGSNNTATGFNALGGDYLFFTSTGSNNTADGASALSSLTTGINNAATGYQALSGNTTGNYNTAHGQGALSVNTTGSNNTAVGQNALLANTTGSSNIALGVSAGSKLVTGSNNIFIGNVGNATTENKDIRIGTAGLHKNAFIAGIFGVTVGSGVPVMVNSDGRLGTITSSARYKDAIRPMDQASESILALKPVTFRYKHELDSAGIPQFGLVAEQVAKVDPDLVVRDEQGQPYTVRYEAVNAMLLNEFLKEHRRVEEQATKSREQDATIAQLESAIVQQHTDFETTVAHQQQAITALTASLKAQAAQIEKVSDQVEANRLAPRVIATNP